MDDRDLHFIFVQDVPNFPVHRHRSSVSTNEHSVLRHRFKDERSAAGLSDEMDGEYRRQQAHTSLYP
jgi:hypothetical protein